MLQGFVYTDGALKRIDFSAMRNLKYMIQRKANIWVDAENPTEEEKNLVIQLFSLKPSLIDDALSPATRSRYRERDNYTEIIFKGLEHISLAESNFYTIALVSGEQNLLTIHKERRESVVELLENHKKLETLLKKGDDYVMHHIIDREVDRYVEARELISTELRRSEDLFLTSTVDETALKNIFLLERIILEIRYRAEGISDLCLMLRKPTENFIHNDLIPYFRDVEDHVNRVNSGLKMYLDRINAMRQSQQSHLSNRLNQSIQILTIIMALMMPMSIITGFYGMNIKLPFQDNIHAYELLILTMITTLIVMVYLFWRFGWIPTGKTK